MEKIPLRNKVLLFHKRSLRIVAENKISPPSLSVTTFYLHLKSLYNIGGTKPIRFWAFLKGRLIEKPFGMSSGITHKGRCQYQRVQRKDYFNEVPIP
jgi:hypothetical protein